MTITATGSTAGSATSVTRHLLPKRTSSRGTIRAVAQNTAANNSPKKTIDFQM